MENACRSQLRETFRITLSDLRFHASIGVADQERKVGNDFRVDMEIMMDASGFSVEQLSTTISYADVYDIISEEMRKEWLLLESVAKTIGRGWQIRGTLLMK